MKKVYYIKEGRKYVPVAEYDSDLVDSFHKGTHLVMVYPGGSSRRYHVDPNYAAMIAAGRIAEDAVSKVIMEASEIRRNTRNASNTPLTPGQKAAWEKLVEEFGPDARQLEWPSAREAAENAVRAMQEEADKLMQHESVRQAYEHFQLVCELTKSHKVEE
jgi:hypothetical protein